MTQKIAVQDPYRMKRQWESLDTSKFTDHYGLEMEVCRTTKCYVDSFYDDYDEDEDRTETLDITIDKDYPVYAVYDYSLDDDDVEYVTSPMPKEMLLKGEWLSKTVHKLHSKRHGFIKGEQPDEFGLHINVNTSHMTKQQIVLLQFVLNTALLSKATDDIRGRSTPYRDSTLRSTAKGHLGRSYESFCQHPLSFTSPRRGEGLACRRSANNRLEIRGFQMNSSVRVIRKRINFIERAKTFLSLYPDYVANLFVEALHDTRKEAEKEGTTFNWGDDYTQASPLMTAKLDRMTRKLLNTTINKRQEFKLGDAEHRAVSAYTQF